jgi:hypothetical protein
VSDRDSVGQARRPENADQGFAQRPPVFLCTKQTVQNNERMTLSVFNKGAGPLAACIEEETDKAPSSGRSRPLSNRRWDRRSETRITLLAHLLGRHFLALLV